MTVKVVGVVGAGQMGSGIAQVFAQSGYDVLLLDSNEVGLQKAVQSIRNSLEKFAAKGKIPIDDGYSISRPAQIEVPRPAF